MIIYMSDIIVFTSRALCRDNFLSRIEQIARQRPKGIVLREKDLTEAEYHILAADVLEICRRYETECILHSFADVAVNLRCRALHMPLHSLRSMTRAERTRFKVLGASCHSQAEAAEAEKLGCTYITAGHIFDTDCKRGLPGRGIEFLHSMCESTLIPVYAIGGISAGNIADVRGAGAAGACVMSGAMTCPDIENYLGDLK
jgi:thiamine-phosphate diphosphorylase